ncbi:MAG: hypothetical protein GY772_32150 [bacterium]|nr:hypothetical protein [bacterium]
MGAIRMFWKHVDAEVESVSRVASEPTGTLNRLSRREAVDSAGDSGLRECSCNPLEFPWSTANQAREPRWIGQDGAFGRPGVFYYVQLSVAVFAPSCRMDVLGVAAQTDLQRKCAHLVPPN